MDQSSTSSKPDFGLRILVFLTVLVTSIINSLIMKQQDDETLADKTKFVHPYFQTCQVFFAQCLVLGVFHLLMRNSTSFKEQVAEKSRETSKAELPLIMALLPAFIDFCGLNITFTAIYAVLPSIMVMMKGTMPVVSALFAVVFLRRRLHSHEKIGALIVFAGAVCSCVEQVALADIEDNTDAVLGLVFTLTSLVVSGFQHVVEQKISKKYYYHPFQLTGYEGVWGLILGLIALVVANFIPCSTSSPFCSGGHLENLVNIRHFLGQDTALLILVIVAIISPVVANLAGMDVKKYIPSAVGTGISVFIPMFAWFYTMFYLKEKFIVTHLIGFLMFGLGTLVFNKVIVIPGLGEKRKKVGLLDSANETSSLFKNTLSE